MSFENVEVKEVKMDVPKKQTTLEWGLVDINFIGEVYKNENNGTFYKTVIIYLNKERTESISVFGSRIRATKNNQFKFNVGFDVDKDIYVSLFKDGRKVGIKQSLKEFKQIFAGEKYPVIKFFDKK